MGDRKGHWLLLTHNWLVRISAFQRQGIAGAAAVVIGGLSAFVISGSTQGRIETPWLIGWVVYGATYLALTLSMAVGVDAAATRRRAQRDDPGAFVLFVVVMLAAWASLGAVVLAVASVHDLQGIARWAQLVLALGSLAVSWSLIQTTFCLHYARLYYRPAQSTGTMRGLEFPGGADPDYLDFLYYSAVVGMTSQVSDVTIVDRHMRRLTLIHGVVSFGFNLVVLALAVNVFAASLG